MYLLKQWRESRNYSVIALLGFLLLLAILIKGSIKIDASQSAGNDHQAFAMMFVALFYFEAVLIAFWGWMLASIGAGKNLGEESGPFLFTRPRRRAWFLWNDWGFGMAYLGVVILLSNLAIGIFLNHVRKLMNISQDISFTSTSNPISLTSLMLLICLGVLIFAGLIYSLTYFSTIIMKRSSGVITGAGILVGYLVIRGIIGHYYPSIQLPNSMPSLFNFDSHRLYGLSDHLGLSLAIRAAVVMLFPVAAQVILDRAEI